MSRMMGSLLRGSRLGVAALVVACAEAALRASPPANAGVLYAIFEPPHGNVSKRYLEDGVESMRMTRRVMEPKYPTFMAASGRGLLGRLEALGPAWDAAGVVALDARIGALAPDAAGNVWLWRMSAQLQSPFEVTLSLDADVVVLRPKLVHSLLSLETDAAAPVDPARYSDGIWGPDSTASAAPPFCGCMLRLTRNALVEAWLLGAAGRLAAKRHPEVRQGDQEMLWFEWQDGRVADRLRLLILPEEYFCPNVPLSGSPALAWNSSWRSSRRRGSYACRAVHGHRNYEVTRARVAYCLGLDDGAFRAECATFARPRDRVQPPAAAG